MSISTQIRGLKEMRETLKNLDKKIRRKVMRAAIQAGNKVLLDEVKRRAPEKSDTRTGTLKKSLGRKVKIFQSGAVGVGIVGARTKFIRVVMRGRRQVKAWAGKYAMLVELGTKAHHIGKGSNKRKGARVGGMHPGTRPNPFVRDSITATASQVLEAMGTVMAAGIATAGG